MTSESPHTLFIGNQIIRLEEVDSTNNFSAALIRDTTIPEGTVVITEKQTSGRGQRGNTWYSEPGKNITCSIILKPVFLNIQNQFDLTRVIALGISDFLKGIFPESEIYIKWPNDIIVNDRKIAGILIENSISSGKISSSVVGIGINVNQENFEEGASSAISIYQLSGKKFELTSLLKPLFRNIEARYLQLRASNLEKLRSDYDNLLFRKGVLSRYTDFDSVFDAVLEEVTVEGLLCLRRQNGQMSQYNFKEIGLLF
ncbi:biotin--[acetyl-CoA-carboxylase] ligase [soil metagenome]